MHIDTSWTELSVSVAIAVIEMPRRISSALISFGVTSYYFLAIN